MLLLAILLAGTSSILAFSTERPNMILLFVDDMGYRDLGCYGNQRNNTPNIDHPAAEGNSWFHCLPKAQQSSPQ